MEYSILPSINASLNAISAILLTFGYVNIRRGRRDTHRKFMIAALISSGLFLTFYLIYHYGVGSVPYPHHDWTRPVYFAILIPHVILAVLMTPFIVIAVLHALKGRFEKHRRIVRWLWPVWMFVSVSGIVVYLMLYQL
ncbi:MAG: DUF420 domain-containing protein [Candidatus Zixiibacteriota bacterium]